MFTAIHAYEFAKRYGIWKAEKKLFQLTLPPKNLLRFFKLNGKIRITVELDHGVHDMILGYCPDMKFEVISRTPEGKQVYLLSIWNYGDVQPWAVQFRGIAEPEDFRMMSGFINAFSPTTNEVMMNALQYVDELPPRDWEVRTPD